MLASSISTKTRPLLVGAVYKPHFLDTRNLCLDPFTDGCRNCPTLHPSILSPNNIDVNSEKVGSEDEISENVKSKLPFR